MCKSSPCKSFSSILFKCFQQLGIAVILQLLETHGSEGTVVRGLQCYFTDSGPALELVLLSNIARNTGGERALPRFSLWLMILLTEGGRESTCHRQLLSLRHRILSQMIHEAFAIIINSVSTSVIDTIILLSGAHTKQPLRLTQ